MITITPKVHLTYIVVLSILYGIIKAIGYRYWLDWVNFNIFILGFYKKYYVVYNNEKWK